MGNFLMLKEGCLPALGRVDSISQRLRAREKDKMLDIAALAPWHQRIRLDDGTETPGTWNCARQVQFLRDSAPWPIAGRVLDTGANAGGIALGLQNEDTEIVAVESNPNYAAQFDFLQEHVNTSRVDYRQQSLFQSHTLGDFDVAMFLGLLYHFLHPQLFLDYCNCISAKRFVFSTQMCGGEGVRAINRSEKTELPDHLGGWHFSERALFLMLDASGFAVNRLVRVEDKAFTNNAYVFCERVKPLRLDPDILARVAGGSRCWR